MPHPSRQSGTSFLDSAKAIFPLHTARSRGSLDVPFKIGREKLFKQYHTFCKLFHHPNREEPRLEIVDCSLQHGNGCVVVPIRAAHKDTTQFRCVDRSFERSKQSRCSSDPYRTQGHETVQNFCSALSVANSRAILLIRTAHKDMRQLRFRVLFSA